MRIGVILLVFVLLLSVTACGHSETVMESTSESQETEPVTMSASDDVETVNGVSEVTTESEVGRTEAVQSKEPDQEEKTMVMAINGETVSELVPCIFKGLSATKKHKYSVKMGGGYSEAHNEEFLKSVIQQTDQHLLVRTKDGHIAIVFHSKQIGVYKDVIYLGKDLFIVVNDDDKYGLIRGGTIRADIIRPFEYVKIELSEDKRNVLLYKTGRARFIPLHSLI